jgi:L-ascorbate metabolism protein UlaG (beta-lactamase superfamily)
MDVRFLGHACFALSDGDTALLIDPFLSGNPRAAASADEVQATTLLLTHGHGDHYGDVVAIGKRTGAPVLAICRRRGWRRSTATSGAPPRLTGGGRSWSRRGTPRRRRRAR